MKNIKLIFIFFSFHFFIMQTNDSLSKETNSNINFYKSSSIKIIQTESWNVKYENLESINNVNIPFFVTDKNVNSVIFSKSFTIPDSILYSKVRLWILGLHGNALIFLNDHMIRKHVNAPTSYYIDFDPKLLKKDNNYIEIKLSKNDENGDTYDFRYPKYPKQFRPLGIAREIYFEFFPNKYFDHIDLKYKDKNLQINYELNITDSSTFKNEKTIKIEEEILSPTGITIHKRFEYLENIISKKQFKRKINIKYPIEWSNEIPELYTIKLTIKSSNFNYFIYKNKFGLRNINTNGSQILLNNEPIEIKGINYRFNFNNNYDYITQAKHDLKIIKGIGFNTVRFINYIPHPTIAQYADSLGILLFIDNGFWRLPDKFYTNNKYFNIGKLITAEMGESFKSNPSVIGMGIGNEPKTNFPPARKFTIVLAKYLKDNFNFLTYSSPIDFNFKAKDKLCDIVLIHNYVNPDKLFSFFENYLDRDLPVIFGGIYYPSNIYKNDVLVARHYKRELNKLQRFFLHYDSLNTYSGYFIESYNDWKGEVPSFYSINDSLNEVIYPFGLVDHNRNKKDKFHFFANYLKNKEIEVSYYKTDQKNNFLSIIVFIISIIFFLVYKRNYRLKENLIRSLQHPYGFFVDLRDRRIISVFNSTLMGLTVGTIISSFVSSIIYANYDSILFDEYINIFITDTDFKLLLLSLLNSPLKLFLFILLTISILQLIFALFLKVLGIFSKEKRKFRQIYSIISWSGSPFLFFIPICLFAYNFATNDIFYPEIIWIFFLFALWYNFRLANGFRVLYMIQPAKMIVLVFLTYLILIISFLLYIKMDITVFEYLKTLSAAQNLY